MEIFNAKPYCENTIKFVQQFGKNFSCKSEDIADMEEILDIIHKDYINKDISEKTAEKIAISMGIYLGQVMLDSKLSECGYEWMVDNNQPCLTKNDNNKMYPIAKVWKRITNGVEDNVKSFYDIGIVIAEGRFDKR